jgi:microcystin-dependent protein
MSRPTLQNGDIWSDSLSNASIRPQVGTQDEPGFFAPLEDLGLSSTPNNIKPRFYDWYDRLRLTVVTGLQLSYQGCKVGLPTGQLVTLSPGVVFLPNNTSGYVFLTYNGLTPIIQASNVLPFERLLIAVYTTLAGVITTFEDARTQSIAMIVPQQLPATTSPWKPGDCKLTFSLTDPEPGWLFAKGQFVEKNFYPDLFNAIGYTHGGSGNIFWLPNCDDCYMVPSAATPVGLKYGTDQIMVGINNMPSHTHATQEKEHLHGFAAIDHNHQVFDPNHSHPHQDRGHNHRTFENARGALIPVKDSSQTGNEVSSSGGGNSTFTTRSDSNITIGANQTGITLGYASANGVVRPANTNLTISANGGNQPITYYPKSIVCRVLIKL